MQPTLGDVHVNVPLTNLSLMYQQASDAFVADKVFPVVPVTNKSDSYWIFDRGDFNRDALAVRGPSTESAGGGYKVTTGTYVAQVWALHKDIDDQTRSNTDAALNPDMNATRFLSNAALISKERAWASTFFAAGIWDTEYAGVASGAVAGTSVIQWNDPSSNPIQDVRTGATAMALKSGGYRPNKLVLGRATFDALCDHPDFIVRINAGQTPGGPAKVTRAIMASLFEVDEVLVMDAVYNTGVERQAATVNLGESNSYIGGKFALLVYTNPAPALETPGCGYNISWTGYYGANGLGTRMKTFRMEWLNSTRAEIEVAYVYKLASASMGLFFNTIVA